ncbi:MAG TPA: hypothetical protein GXX29_08520 [Firmicutes bacterium]|nr:hypothetical protein [Bacillota bacterium]
MRKMRRLLWLSLMLLIVSLVGYPTMAAKIPIAMRLASSQGTLPQWIQDFAKEFNANNPNIELRVEILAGTNTHFASIPPGTWPLNGI